jgi:hypothetical protein
MRCEESTLVRLPAAACGKLGGARFFSGAFEFSSEPSGGRCYGSATAEIVHPRASWSLDSLLAPNEERRHG